MNDTTLSAKQSLTFHEEIAESLLQLRMAIERLDAFVTGLNGGIVNATVDVDTPIELSLPVDVDTPIELSLHQTLKSTPTTIAEHVKHIEELRKMLGELLYGW